MNKYYDPTEEFKPFVKVNTTGFHPNKKKFLSLPKEVQKENTPSSK